MLPLLLAVLPLMAAAAAGGGTLRIATWNVEMTRPGPGLLLRDILRGDDPQIEAAVAVLARLDADVLLLTGVDYDAGLAVAGRLAERLARAGVPYPHRFALRPNSGWQTGIDLDGDGRAGRPDDAQGWGLFAGQKGMLLLSRLAIDEGAARDFSRFLWADLPGALLPPAPGNEALAIQRLSSKGHWEVPLILPDGGRLRLLAFHATPPVFGGGTGRNARRNHDEAAFWLALLDGRLPFPPPEPPFLLIGDSNLDPEDGDGHHDAIRALLAHPLLNDVRPRGAASRHDPGQRGDPALDTALFAATGGLRVDLVVPGTGLGLAGAGVMWPEAGDPLLAEITATSRHFPVWVDISLAGAAAAGAGADQPRD